MKIKTPVVMCLIAVFLASCASSRTRPPSPKPSFVPASLHKRAFDDRPYFKRGSSDLDATAHAAMAEAATLILRYMIRVKIVGHTDNCDNEATNLALSQRRARVVKQELLSLGVPEDRIVSVSGIGSSQKRLGVEPCSIPSNDRVDIDVADL